MQALCKLPAQDSSPLTFNRGASYKTEFLKERECISCARRQRERLFFHCGIKVQRADVGYSTVSPSRAWRRRRGRDSRTSVCTASAGSDENVVVEKASSDSEGYDNFFRNLGAPEWKPKEVPKPSLIDLLMSPRTPLHVKAGIVGAVFLVVAFHKTILREVASWAVVAWGVLVTIATVLVTIVQLAWDPLGVRIAAMPAGPVVDKIVQALVLAPVVLVKAVFFVIDVAPVGAILGTLVAAWAALSLLGRMSKSSPWMLGMDATLAVGIVTAAGFLPWPTMFLAMAAAGAYSHYGLGSDWASAVTPAVMTLLCVGTAPVKVVILAALAAVLARMQGLKGAWSKLMEENGKGGALVLQSGVARFFLGVVIVATVGRFVMIPQFGEAPVS